MSGKKKMSKMALTLIVGAAVIVLLAGALVLLLVTGDGGASSSAAVSSEAGEYLITGKTAEEVASIDVANESGSYTLTKTGEDYAVASYLEPGASQVQTVSKDTRFLSTTMESFAEGLFTTTVTEKIEGGAEKLDVYGLAKPQATVKVHYSDGTAFSIDVGATAPDGKSYYVYNPQTKEVCLIATVDLSRALSKKEQYADLTLIPVAAEEGQLPDALTLGGSVRPEPVVIEKDDEEATSVSGVALTSGFHVASPKNKPANVDTMQEFTATLFGTAAASAEYLNPTPAQLAETGLATPYSTLKVTFGGQTVQLSLGNKTDDGYYYCQTSLNTAIFRVSQDAVPWVEYTAFELYDKFAAIPNINDVSAVTVEIAGKPYRFEVGHGENNAVMIKYGNADLSDEAFKAYYQLLISAIGEKEATALPEGAPTVLKYTYEFVDAARPDIVVEFKPLDDRQTAIIADGDMTFSIRSLYVDKVTSSIDSVLAGEKITISW